MAIGSTPRMTAQERQWRAESALRTIQEHDRIVSDKKLMADVKSLAKKQVATLAKVVKKK